MPKEFYDWKIWVGALFGCFGLWAMCWGFAIVCVAAGGSVDVCGI